MKSSSDVRDSFKYLYPNELPFLKSLVETLGPSPVVVNIGAGAGTSGLAILESRPDVTLITIDVQDESSPFGCLEAERDVISDAGLDYNWGSRWFQIHSDSKIVAVNWPSFQNVIPRIAGDVMVDMVFVDGNHSFLGAAGDIINWLAWIKHGGTIAVHDYKKEDLAPDANGPHPVPWPGVDRAVDVLLRGVHPTINLVDSLIAVVVDRAKLEDANNW